MYDDICSAGLVGLVDVPGVNKSFLVLIADEVILHIHEAG